MMGAGTIIGIVVSWAASHIAHEVVLGLGGRAVQKWRERPAAHLERQLEEMRAEKERLEAENAALSKATATRRRKS